MKKIWNYLKYIFWLAPVLIVAGIAAGVLETGGLSPATWGPLPLGLLIAGMAVLGFWLLLKIASAESFWNSRSTSAGANAIISTIAVLLILAMINLLAVRYQVEIDLTEDQRFTVALETKQVLRNLSQPVKLWIFSPQVNPQSAELLENYQDLGGDRFNFEYVDPYSRPGLASEFGVTEVGDVYLELLSPNSQRREFVGNVTRKPLSESQLTNSIVLIKRDRTTLVYFLQGHGERPLEGRGSLYQAVRSLKQKNFISQPLNLAQRKAVPENADVVAIAGPERELLPEEVAALDDYLDGGGSLLLAIDPFQNPGLDSLLRKWGVKLDDRVAVDINRRLPTIIAIADYGDHPITENFGNGFSFYSLARSIEITKVPGVQEAPLLITSAEGIWAESDSKSQELEFDPKSDRQGPLILGVALTRSLNNPEVTEPEADTSEDVTPSPETDASEDVTPSPETDASAEKEPPISIARMVAIGDSEFAIDGNFGQQLNGDVFLNAIGWLADSDEETFSIRPKEFTNRRIILTENQAIILFLTSVAIVPALGFLTAGTLWLIRR
ncbi:MAG: Gldg family protein [Hormoscilla sp. SP5CHS1]|nr:Gldg family protein [Hormoscilla sp. SP12CHS1]MBC6453124.1 Gldg family protein [Hormoscilla sp. SP5CHS1]